MVDFDSDNKKKVYDPFLPFGWGIVSYFSLLKYLTLVFFVFTVFSIPTYVIYFQGGQF